jgi:SIR2-like protein
MSDQIEATVPEGHARLVINKMLEGRVVPFLGAGVNLCDRPKNFEWEGSEQRYLPSGWELARELADKFEYPDAAKVCKAPADLCLRPRPELDLARISQYGDLTQGTGVLYEKLRILFTREFPPTKVHEFLAALPPAEPERGRPENRNLLIVTTNYDDLMERAFVSMRPCDVVFFDPDDKPARFWHRRPDGTTVKVIDPTSYDYAFFDEGPVVLKIHGTIDRSNQGREGYVITEDHYIEYLAEEALEKLLPKDFLTKLRSNHLLFLGYSLRDWNLRVFLRRLKRNPKQAYKAWAVLPHVDALEEQFWQRQEVGIVKVTLKTYIDGLEQELARRRAQPAAGPGDGASDG